MTYEAIDLIAIDVPHPSFLGPPALETTRLLAGMRFARTTDTSAKRNIGLILSKLAGWQRIVFLDDDIKVPNPDDLRRACALLDPGHYQAVGLAIEGFPDNSVVCHAFRETGGKQDTFVGGGALAVDISGNPVAVPEHLQRGLVLPAGCGRGPAAAGHRRDRGAGRIRSLCERQPARSEELGDVLAKVFLAAG